MEELAEVDPQPAQIGKDLWGGELDPRFAKGEIGPFTFTAKYAQLMGQSFSGKTNVIGDEQV